MIPKHIAIIMDGNRRWAKERGLPVLEGHRRVTDSILEPLVAHASQLGISYLTFWAWSTENWRRDAEEVTGIMKLFHHVVQSKWQRLHKKGVRIRIIGDTSQFDPQLRASLADVVKKTKDNSVITTIFALNYGGRDEILRAVKTYAVAQGTVEHITPETFSNFLDTAEIPDPELIIRTGGEQRLSGFLLWQSEYSELYFPSWYMPEFTPEKLDEALAEFSHRKRNFGK